MLDGLWIASAAPAVDAALAALPAGEVAVLGHPRLARALTARGRANTALAPDAALPPGQFAAVVAVGAGERDDWAAAVAGWAAALIDGGGLVLVDRAAPVEMSRRALCAGLTALEQRLAGRWVITSGVATRL